MMNPKSVLVEHKTETRNLNCSGILFNDNWVLFPASIFISNLQTLPDYLINLPSGQLCYKNYFNIKETNTKIVGDSKPTCSITPAKFYACFSCKNLRQTENFPLVPSDIENHRHITFILSLFIIVNVGSESNDFLASVEKLLKDCKEAIKGDDIYVDSTPFGSRDLIASRTRGIVSNCFGENGSYFLTDSSTAPCSEGAPIYSFCTYR